MGFSRTHPVAGSAGVGVLLLVAALSTSAALGEEA